MHIFYTPQIGSEDNTHTLSEEESKHCARVLRLTVGDEVHLIDGRGGLFLARITDDHPKRVTLEVVQRTLEYGRRSHYLHIAVAPTKNTDRLEWFAEKATELGIDEITPLLCERSERRVLKTDRLEKVVIAAVKQSLKAYLPIVNPPTDFKKLVEQSEADYKGIAHCMDEGAKVFLNTFIKPGSRTLILIGPEGDFSKGEVESALRNNFKAITLGDARLRTETAALAACFEENLLNRQPVSP